jgi:hypothetical protein
MARAAWTLGPRSGPQFAEATVAGQTVRFHATAVEPVALGSVRTMALTTYDGSGELVHPDIVRVPRGWAPARRFLAITPYPNGNRQFENPSIYASGDVAAWEPPTGVLNPVVRPATGYLSDPDVVFEPEKSQLWLYYRQVGGENTVFLTTSGDGSHWSNPVVVVHAPNHQIVSPSVVRVGPRDWHMWAVNAGAVGCANPTTTVEHRTSVDGLHWSPAQTVAVGGGELSPWHIDVTWVPEFQQFWALFNGKPSDSCTTPALFLATSPDGVTWHTYEHPILEAGSIPEFRDIVYRSTLEYEPHGDAVTLWYSGAIAVDQHWVWRAAVQRVPRADLFQMAELPVLRVRSWRTRKSPRLLIAP